MHCIFNISWSVCASPGHVWRVAITRDVEESASSESFDHSSDLNRPGQCYCGVPNAATPVNEIDPKIVFSERIVGGNKTLLGEYPWQVALLSQGVISGHICGGTLVTSKHVVTAAHCTTGLTPDTLAVAVGYTNLSSTASDRFIIPVKKIKDHPNYQGKATNFENDISVLELAEEVDLLSFPHIKPICLPSATGTRPDQGWYVGESAVVSGWGLTDFFFGTYPQHLKDVEVTVFGNKNCGGLSDYIRESQFCAGDVNGGKDACSGDSGGPLMAKDPENDMAATLIGVVSAGSACADKDLPGLYTDVKKYCMDGWLEEQIVGGKVCSPPAGRENLETTTSSPEITTDRHVELNTTNSSIAKLIEKEKMAVLIVGGDGYSFGKKVEVWSTNPLCNKQLPDLPDYRSYHDSALLDGVPVVCGGKRSLQTCLSLNLNFGWEKFTSPKAYRSNHMMVSYGQGFIMIGGTWSKTVEYFFQGDATLLDGTTPRLENSCAVLTDTDSIIITGGKGGTKYRVQAWEFSLQTGIWTPLTDIPEGGRYEHACTFFNQDGFRGVIIAGGSTGTRIETSSFFLDLNSGKWHKIGSLNLKRWGGRMISLNGKIFMIGGGDGRDYIKSIEELDTKTFVWKPVNGNLMFPRSDFSVVTIPQSQLGCDEDDELNNLLDPRKL